MTIVRGPRLSRDFTVISNDVLRDERLSYRARGLLASMLSYPPEWAVNSTQLARKGSEGRDAVRTALTELETVGYLVRETVRSEDGTIRTVSTVLESPEPGKPAPGNPTPDNQAPLEEVTTKECQEVDETSSSNAQAESRETTLARSYWDWHKDAHGGQPSIAWLPLVAVCKAVAKRGYSDAEIGAALQTIRNVKPTTALVIAAIADARRAIEAAPTTPAIPPRHLTWFNAVLQAYADDPARLVVLRAAKQDILTAITIITGPTWAMSDFEAYYRLGVYWHHARWGAEVTVDALMDRKMPVNRDAARPGSWTALSAFTAGLRGGDWR